MGLGRVIPSTLVAFLKPHFYRLLRSKSADVVYVLLVQLWGLGERCKLPQRVLADPAAERYLLYFGLKKASHESNFTCIFTKEYQQIDKLRDLVYIHSKPTFTGEQSPLICFAAPRPGSSWLSIRHAARILATNSRWTRRTTSEVPAGGSAHILQHDRLSVQHVACYIHSTEVVERS